MVIYFITIIISILIVSQSFICKNNIQAIIISLIGIIPLCLLAGFRDITVGHDLIYYMVPTYEKLLEVKTFKGFLMFMASSSEMDFAPEPLWLIFHYIISRFSQDLFWPFFMQQVLVLGLIVNTCFYFRNRLNPTLLYATFVFYFYCFSMSANRQIFAIAIVIWSMRYIFAESSKQNIIRYVICILIAWGFHGSGLLVLLILPLYKYSVNNEKILSQKKIIMVMFMGLLLYFCFGYVTNLLVSFGILSMKYGKYANMDYGVHKINLLLWVIVLLFLFQKRKKIIYDNISIVFVLTSIFMLFCGVYNDVATRFAMYLDIVSFISIGISLHRKDYKKYSPFFMVLIVSMFLYLAITTGYAEAIPYTSKELGIDI